MKAIEINKILEANEWFVAADESAVVEVLTKQPVLSGLVQVIIEEDLKESDEYSKDMFYSLFGTILKSYIDTFGDDFKEVSEEDIDEAFAKQNKFAEMLSASLGIKGDVPTEAEEEKAVEMMEKLADLENKFKEDENFNLEEAGFGDLAELMSQVNQEIKQPSMVAFLQNELEEADLDENSAGFLNQQFNILLDAIEIMFERSSENGNMRIV